MARRGRPRKLHSRRHPNGSVIRHGIVTCTPELSLRRARLAGPGGDVVMSTSPIDILATRHIIDQDTHQAAMWYASLARIVLGRPHARSCLDETMDGEPSDAAMRWGSIGYAFVAATLDAPERAELIELIHFSILPHWLVKTVNASVLRPGDLAARARALKALSRLEYVRARWRAAGLPPAGAERAEPRVLAAAE